MDCVWVDDKHGIVCVLLHAPCVVYFVKCRIGLLIVYQLFYI